MSQDLLRDLRLGARLDLHLHSNRSDGAFTPEQVLARCAAAKLDVIALTDHDLPPDLEPGVHQVDGRAVHVLAGAEVSGQHQGKEHHLLVYFPGAVPDVFRAFCRRQCQERASRYATALVNLETPDLPGPDHDALLGERALTRFHLAQELVATGRAAHVGDAFSRLIGDRHGTVPHLETELVDVIALANECGGITSWAHPSLADVEAHLPTLAAAGLHALEAFRPYLKTRERSRLRKMARRHGLALTGGSDWHGWAGERVGLFHVTPQEVSGFVDLLRAA